MDADADLHTLLGPYLLHALDDGERAAYERHLSGCEACREEVRGLRATVTALATPAADAAHGQAVDRAAGPPPGLRARVLAAALATPQLPPSPRVPAPRGQRRRRWAVALAGLAATAAVAVGGVALWPDDEAPRMGAQQVEAQRMEAEAAEVMAAPDVRVHAMPTDGGTVTVAMSHEMHKVAVDVSGLEEPEEGMGYQLWWVTDAGADPVAVLGEASSVAAPVVEGELVLTLEPESGSARPTSEPLVEMASTDL